MNLTSLYQVLGDKIERVAVTNRLTDSPAIVVASKFGWSANMEKIMRAQALGDPRAAEYMKGRRVMEINPEHSIIKSLLDLVSLDSVEAKGKVQLLYDAAALSGGFAIDNPQELAGRIYSLMGTDGQPSGSSSSSSSGATEVDAEIV